MRSALFLAAVFLALIRPGEAAAPRPPLETVLQSSANLHQYGASAISPYRRSW